MDAYDDGYDIYCMCGSLAKWTRVFVLGFYKGLIIVNSIAKRV
jgi:hypothetical protein